MYAVIKTGGKQYKVSPEQVLKVEKIEGEAGTAISFDQVLMVGEEGAAPTVGAPLVSGMAVQGEIVKQTRGDKIIVFKKQRRQNHRRKKGHKQDLTLVRITGIGAAQE
ncbi:MAG: 50S ribosomal protein L21 [Magnetospiraceae bacterium]